MKKSKFAAAGAGATSGAVTGADKDGGKFVDSKAAAAAASAALADRVI